MKSVPHDYGNLPDIDPSRAAAEQLNALINEKDGHQDVVIVDEKILTREAARAQEAGEQSDEPQEQERYFVPASEARKGAQMIQTVSERNSVRLLLLTKNVAMRQLGSLAQKRLLELSKIFAEIHVVILNEFSEETTSTVRLADNVWLYSTDSQYWWKMGYDAYTMANEQLVFAGGFRVDIIVAEDPFECAAVGYAIAQKYGRPLQIHVLEDVFSEEFHDMDEHPVVRSLISQFVLKRADSIRTSTPYLRDTIAHEYPEMTPVTEVLPIYYNLEAWRDAKPGLDLKARYPQFKFLILHVSSMQTDSHTREVIQGVAPILRTYPTIGLVIVGNGPHRPALEKQAISLGIHGQVEFEPVPDEVISHMKTANVLIHLSTNAAEDAAVLQAATVKLPIIASTTNIAGDLFKDDESAYLCDSTDPACVSQRLKMLLNDNQSRVRVALQAQDIVFDRIERDYTAYLLAYRSSIERCVA